MRKSLMILFIFMPFIGYAQDIDIQKIKKKAIENDSLLSVSIENYALSEGTIEKGMLYDKADIYFIGSIPMQKETMSVYVFTMPSSASFIDWRIMIRKGNSLSFYSYDINLYRLVYDLSSVAAAAETSMVSLDIISVIYDILSYCSDYYNEMKYEIADNDVYGYSIFAWVQIFKKKDFTFHNKDCNKEKGEPLPIKILNLQAMERRPLFHSSINNWLKKTYGTFDLNYKLYKVVDVCSYKAVFLLETKYSQRKKFDFVFQTNNTLSFYLTDRLFVPLAFKMKDFIGEKKQYELLKALKCLCLSYSDLNKN